MADKKTAGEMYPVETLQTKTSTSAALHQGVCCENGWKPGKMLTTEQYTRAVAAFSRQPIGRR